MRKNNKVITVTIKSEKQQSEKLQKFVCLSVNFSSLNQVKNEAYQHIRILQLKAPGNDHIETTNN